MNFQMLKSKFAQVVAAIKQTLAKAKLNLATFWANHKRTILRVLALVVIGVVASVLCVYFWRRSPVFRAIVLAIVAGLALGMNNILSWLKNHVPQEQPVLVVRHPSDALMGEPAADYTGFNVVTAEDERLFVAADGRLN